MVKSTQTLTIGRIEKLKPKSSNQFITDGKQEGLQLVVTPRGVKTFYFRHRENGKQQRERLGRWPDLTLERARDAVRVRLSAKHGGELVADSQKTFADAFQCWLNGYAKKSKKTWKEDVRKFERDLKPIHETMLKSLTQTTVERLHNDLGESNGRTHANRCLALIKTILNYVIDRDDFPFNSKNPARGITKFPEKERERCLTSGELKRFSVALMAENELWRDFFTVCLFTGVRRGNVQAMAWADVDLVRAEWFIPDTKSGKAQRVALTPNIVELLRQHKAAAHPRCSWVFPSSRKPFTHIVDCRKSWLRITKAANLRDVHIHDLRRTLGSWQAQQGISELIIGKSLGHAAGSKATHIYARLDMSTVREAVEGTAAVMLEAMNVKR